MFERKRATVLADRARAALSELRSEGA
jgi:hypothetical protein